MKPCIKEFCIVIYLISLTTGLISRYQDISPRMISRYHQRKDQRNRLLVTKEALIGEHNLKPLLTGHKESIDWQSLLGNKPVITQVHSYDILVINTHPWLRLGLCNNKDIILILGYNYNITSVNIFKEP